jgi:hypothetical protein
MLKDGRSLLIIVVNMIAAMSATRGGVVARISL